MRLRGGILLGRDNFGGITMDERIEKFLGALSTDMQETIGLDTDLPGLIGYDSMAKMMMLSILVDEFLDGQEIPVEEVPGIIKAIKTPRELLERFGVKT